MHFFVATLVIILSVNQSFCDNITKNYVTMDKSFQSRQSRLLSFNTQDNGDISVELAFNVPFISIPVKKSLSMAQGAIANLNIGAVILAGSIVIGIAVIIPAILVFFTKKMNVPFPGSSGPYRNENENSPFWHYLSLMDHTLMENNIDTTTCMQRMVCWTTKNSSKNVFSGKGTSTDKILDGLANSKWVQQAIFDTAIYSALKNGLDGGNCAKEYEKCRINQRSVHMFVNKFIKTINGDV